MAWLVHNGAWDWTIRDAADDPETGETADLMDFSAGGSALAFLQAVAADHANATTLRDLALERYRGSDISNLTDRRLLELVADELETGRLQIIERYRLLHIGGRAQAPAGGQGGDAPFAPPVEPEKPEKTWITFEVKDDDTGQPVAGVTLAIKLPDGSVKKMATDGSGKIEIKDIDPGSCDIESMTDAYALEVLSIT